MGPDPGIAAGIAIGALATYARIGANNGGRQLAFIAPDVRLVCPMFAQYPFDDLWSSVVNCLTDRRPDLIVVSPGFVAATIVPHPSPEHDSAIARRAAPTVRTIRARITAHCVPVVARHYPCGGIVVWARAISAGRPLR